MTLHEPAVQHSKSVAELEMENYALQRKLKEAEEIIRSFKAGAADRNQWLQAEESLRQSESRLQLELADTKLLQSISSVLIHQEDVDALYEKIVEAARAIMQSDFATMQMYYPERESVGQLRLLASSGLKQEALDFWAWVDASAGTACSVAMRTGKRFMSSDMFNCEYVVDTPDHEMFIRSNVRAAQSTPLFSRNGMLLGMLSTHWARHHTPSDRDFNLLDILGRQAADLIERKLAEEALYQSKLALTLADQRKDEFLATLSHELRNPLSSIRNALHIMKTAPEGSEITGLLAIMDRQVSHLACLISDLLDVSRISHGKIELRLERMTLQSAIKDAEEATRALIESRSHTLILDLPDAPIWLEADSTRMSQIVGNLLNNAAKYTPPNGRITLAAYEEDGYGVLTVSDNGMGIPDDMLSQVFDLFTQVDNNLERSQGGLGIGLALVRQLMDMHHGTIEAKSAGLNQGSTFTLRLPLAPAATADAQKPVAVPSIASAPLRILVVDDNISSAQTVGWMLEMDGHELALAHDGNEAIAMADRFDPQVILLDIGLPRINGYDVCRAIRQDPRFQSTLMIAQTGWGQERDRQLAKEAGFDHHLVKPFTSQQLSGLLALYSAPG